MSPLISDRIPLLLLERCKISTSGNSVVAKKDSQIMNIPIRSIQLLILGNGVSITSEAMSLCAKERCHVAQSKGGLSIHTVFHSGLYSNPSRLIKQVLLTTDPVSRLRIAKYIAISKLKSFVTDTTLATEAIKRSNSIEVILGVEGSATKKEYRHVYGDDFKREFEHTDSINSSISVLNSVLYSFITSVVCSLGYSPSVGFLHGHTRRGGLVFDIADMFKHRLYCSDLNLLKSNTNISRELSGILQSNKNKMVKEIIATVEAVCSGQHGIDAL